ncbi:hypothetical protein ANRL4_04860 [Anaerolineae bacterium]|nr:hypothetical protein ANRL4_04860 [Anaerolineae bacterium]
MASSRTRNKYGIYALALIPLRSLRGARLRAGEGGIRDSEGQTPRTPRSGGCGGRPHKRFLPSPSCEAAVGRGTGGFQG